MVGGQRGSEPYKQELILPLFLITGSTIPYLLLAHTWGYYSKPETFKKKLFDHLTALLCHGLGTRSD
jgi:hypothetical protein